jgi:hypothetical protein
MFSGNYHTPHATSTNSETIKRFWDRFINISVKQGVGESYLRWYVIRAEQCRRWCQSEDICRIPQTSIIEPAAQRPCDLVRDKVDV